MTVSFAAGLEPPLQPMGHLAWAFSHPAQFEGRATPFLADGARRGERLMLVADNPIVEQWPSELLERGELVIASIRDVYGEERTVVPETQRATFEGVLGDALREGYTGIRVMADNTSLIVGPDRLAAWMAWEEIADAFMAENPVTGLCAFDRSRVDQDTIDRVLCSHTHTLNN